MMDNLQWNHDLQFFEYLRESNPKMPPVLLKSMIGLTDSEIKKSQIMTLDLSKTLETNYTATSPNCVANFVYIQKNDTIKTLAKATSHLFVVIRGMGKTKTSYGDVQWSKGDVITIPYCELISHTAHENSMLYWVNDEPLLQYLGAIPQKAIFKPTHYPFEKIVEAAEKVNRDPLAPKRNRNGVLLGNPDCPLTHTITPVLWSLYNTIHPGQVQAPHRHNSVALDLCLVASPGVYTLMGEKLDKNGHIINPQRADWAPGSMFVTPPGWWHSHHNESNADAIVFPVQDAGLQTYMRTLNIEFAAGGPSINDK